MNPQDSNSTKPNSAMPPHKNAQLMMKVLIFGGGVIVGLALMTIIWLVATRINNAASDNANTSTSTSTQTLNTTNTSSAITTSNATITSNTANSTSSSAAVKMQTCTLEGLKMSFQVPANWTCEAMGSDVGSSDGQALYNVTGIYKASGDGYSVFIYVDGIDPCLNSTPAAGCSKTAYVTSSMVTSYLINQSNSEYRVQGTVQIAYGEGFYPGIEILYTGSNKAPTAANDSVMKGILNSIKKV